MNWLITGGAGYIGSHVIRDTLKSGRTAIVLDDLSTGDSSRIPESVILEQATLTDKNAVDKIFSRHDIHGVLHLAAKKKVNESIEKPAFYWEQNIGGLNNLLSAMATSRVRKFVFSSSAAVYGEPQLDSGALITEQTSSLPINPYGTTKLVGEWYAHARTVSDGFSVAALRYFNVAGAGKPELGDTFIYNLIPLILEAISENRTPRIYGDDYSTPDGTCIRDYIHVQDLSEAHIAAMDLVDSQNGVFQTINIGTGSGSSVREVINMVSAVTGIEINPDIVARRLGDPAMSVAAVDKARDLLGWSSKYGLHDIVSSAWEAWQHAKK